MDSIFRFRRRNSSLENLNQLLAADGLSDQPKAEEDRVVKFKDVNDDDECDGTRQRSKAEEESKGRRGRARNKEGRSRSRGRQGGAAGKKALPVPAAAPTASILKDPSKPKIVKQEEVSTGEAKESEEAKKKVAMKAEPKASQEESGYDSDLTPVKTGSSSPGSSRGSVSKVDEIEEEIAEGPPPATKGLSEVTSLLVDTEERDLSLESIMTRNGALLHPPASKLKGCDSFRDGGRSRVERDFGRCLFGEGGPRSVPHCPAPLTTNPRSTFAPSSSASLLMSLPPLTTKNRGLELPLPGAAAEMAKKKSVREMINHIEGMNKTDEEKLAEPDTCDEANVTSLQVEWETPTKGENANAAEDSGAEEELEAAMALSADGEAAAASVVSAASSASVPVPVNFGESLSPALAALADKQFSLHRVKKFR